MPASARRGTRPKLERMRQRALERIAAFVVVSGRSPNSASAVASCAYKAYHYGLITAKQLRLLGGSVGGR